MFEYFQNTFDHFPDFVYNLILIAAAIIGGLIIRAIFSLLMKFYTKEKNFSLVRSILKHLTRPLSFFLPLLLLNMSLPFMQIGDKFSALAHKLIGIALIISFASILISIVKVVEDYVYYAYDLHKSDNLRERKIRTQLQFLRKLIVTIIFVLAGCAVLLSFESLRRIGAGLLTGVGIGGIIIGFAAQKSLSNLLAGFQIAFTQPIRIDDVLVVEGEWGRVEEITLTYVVLNIWDQRRLILPINYFIEKPFQNWTRTGSAILGTVFLYLDYRIPINDIRKEFDRLLKETKLFDGRASVVQVTDVRERTVEVRLLVSANNSGQAFDLRCYIRENMILFLQKNYPDCLPHTRVILTQDANLKEGNEDHSQLFSEETVRSQQ
ncbi:MAG: mechanosensitive ion channel family protein [Ilyomonas sp.]